MTEQGPVEDLLMLHHDAEEEEQEEESTDPSIYLETEHTTRSTITTWPRSLVPPLSWPSSANLHKDDDVYPHERSSQSKTHTDSIKSIIEEEEHISSLDRTTTVSSSGFGQTHGRKEFLKVTDFGLDKLNETLDLPIRVAIIKKLCFAETLVVSFYKKDCSCQLINPSKTCEVGGMCISIEEIENKLVTYCTAQFSYLGRGANCTILSIVDKSFNLIEEKKTEILCEDNGKKEKSLRVVPSTNGFIAFRESVNGSKITQDCGRLQLKVDGSFLLDGGGYVLMRYLILKKFTGNLEVWSMHISGELMKCTFSVGKEKAMAIGCNLYHTIRIKKMFFRRDKNPDITETHFLPTGHIVRHRWKGCPYFLHIIPTEKIPPDNYHLCLERKWKDEVKHFTNYLNAKVVEVERSEKVELTCSKRVGCKIKDYMLCLVQLKSNDVVEFTIENLLRVLKKC